MAVVELTNVSKYYDQLEVLKDISWSLEQGQTLGLFGHNGAGKTTTVRLILGLTGTSSGQISVLGKQGGGIDAHREIGFLPENVMFYPQLTGREILTYFARLKGASIGQVNDLLEQVGLASAAKHRIKTYSKGMRQRLGLAQALLGEPKLLILDEPTVGLDPIATQELYELMGKMQKQGTSIIICSHVLPGVEPFINQAVILARGQLEASGKLSELRQQADLPVKIIATGLSLPINHYSIMAHKELAHQCHEFSVQDSNKLALLEQIIKGSPQDVEIKSPSLADLYCYYMQRAGALGAAGVQ
ncbi:ABC transporter ATP-binding protein [Oceanisphaera avium]|uniref:Copper ABC transporter ATP-binding protein n=1 Tax=Oceanisphaera avium TaxID=1903694 RepID=A0A1Y0CZD9_9GAMM|nr:ABC transporter ATP-binding protein [Oceanisphaera avium]ART80690.1 copper ABC transporter ATP-binding protein [Oceanisphaera avium]